MCHMNFSGMYINLFLESDTSIKCQMLQMTYYVYTDNNRVSETILKKWRNKIINIHNQLKRANTT